MKKLLEDFDIVHVMNTLLETFKNAGYIVRKVQKPPYIGHRNNTYVYERYSARNDSRGVKYSLESTVSTTDGGTVDSKCIEVNTEIRDIRGRYLKSRGYRLNITNQSNNFGPKDLWREWLADTVTVINDARGETVTDPLLNGKNSLNAFPPIKFDKPGYTYEKPDGGGPVAWTMNCFYRSCRVRGVATILPNLKVNVDEVMKPGTHPWFYIIGECLAKRSGAQPEIIVSEQNGALAFYPVRNGRVTNELQPLNTYIDYTKITEIDAILVEKAIKTFCEAL